MAPPLPTFAEQLGPAEEDLYKCVHCGFCLQACPTYVETGLETESPRGRIALMKAVRSGRIGITDSVIQHWELCIQCRACEAACPSGVPYGRMIEATVAETARQRSSSWVSRLVSACRTQSRAAAPTSAVDGRRRRSPLSKVRPARRCSQAAATEAVPACA